MPILGNRGVISVRKRVLKGEGDFLNRVKPL